MGISLEMEDRPLLKFFTAFGKAKYWDWNKSMSSFIEKIVHADFQKGMQRVVTGLLIF